MSEQVTKKYLPFFILRLKRVFFIDKKKKADHKLAKQSAIRKLFFLAQTKLAG